MSMENYDTYTFERKSHYNECAPDVKLEFTAHEEERLDVVIRMMMKFLYSCGYSEEGIRARMGDLAEY